MLTSFVLKRSLKDSLMVFVNGTLKRHSMATHKTCTMVVYLCEVGRGQVLASSLQYT